MLLCNPHNPTGSVVARGPSSRRSPTLAAEHEAWILADEIHAPLTLPGAEHVPFLTVSDERGRPRHRPGVGIEDVQPRRPRLRPDRHRRRARPGGRRRSAVLRPALRPLRRDRDRGRLPSRRRVARRGDRGPRPQPGAARPSLLAERLPDARCEPPRAGYLAWIDLSRLRARRRPGGADPRARPGRASAPGRCSVRGGDGHIRLNVGTSPDLVRARSSGWRAASMR